MKLLYILIVLFSINAFLSSKINTDNLMAKIALLFMIVGALIAHYQFDRFIRIENPFIAMGALLHFISDYITAHFRKHQSRKDDEVSQ